jgi:hypothetical protein
MTSMFEFPHAQCNNCGKMVRGSHENEVYNERRDAAGGIEPIFAADEQAVYYQDEAEAKGLAYNVGSSMCTDCYQDTYRRYKAAKQAGSVHREEVREQRRLAREKYDAQIAARKAYQERKRAEGRAGYEARMTNQVRRRYIAQGKPPEEPTA